MCFHRSFSSNQKLNQSLQILIKQQNKTETLFPELRKQNGKIGKGKWLKIVKIGGYDLQLRGSKEEKEPRKEDKGVLK